jgi:hypothetical protein
VPRPFRRHAAQGNDEEAGEDFVPTTHKLEFPKFDGTGDPLPWLNRCERYFRLRRTPEDKKVSYAAFNLLDDAQLWFYRLELNGGMPTWSRFVRLVNTRFEPLLMDSPIGELAHLRREGMVEEYCTKFMSLACCEPTLSEGFQVQLFVAGLGEPLRTDIALHQPATIDEAVKFAQAHEKRAAYTPTLVQPPLPKTALRLFVRATQGGQQQQSASTTASSPSIAKPPAVKKLSPAEIAEHRKTGHCFHCDDLFTHGHKQVCKQLFVIEVLGNEESDAWPGESAEPTISLHALTGIQPRCTRTMQLLVMLHGVKLTALLDSRSTHNFVDTDAAARAGIKLQGRAGLHVAVVNDDRLTSSGSYLGLHIQIGDEPFEIDCYGLALGSFDMVLGVQWLEALGPILWDFDRRTMGFVRNDHHILWHASDTEGSRSSLHAISESANDDNTGNLMDDLLEQFVPLFEAPIGLPPQRTRCHKIRLLSGTAPVAVRPYRYAHMQKPELECQCAEMLQQGIIRPSSSAFSAPVLLVKKSDSSWRLCVDYRALNNNTIKDKFPILVVEELLDELRGAKYFTKLDLRSGYHQVRMSPDDVEKTAFRTHEGLFEFLVMPFGLTNAPATFQALMNDILKPFIRRFMLVFFDDILIYSSSWSEHLRHVQLVLAKLQEHSLFMKNSKCAFGACSVVYLGHIISEASVAMDAQKMQAVLDWPLLRTVRAVRGFLGLAGYYRRFIKDYGAIATPLTTLLCKDSFRWSPEVEKAFRTLQRALTTAPVL